MRRHIAVTYHYTYTVFLEPMEERGFLVYVPALPEVVTGGDTEDEAMAMAKEAIELVLASRRERGEEIPVETGKAQMREVTVSLAA
jgi:antitoxin HicB